MKNRQQQEHHLVQRIDRAIRERIQEAYESDRRGIPHAAIPASDKYGLARECGVELDEIQERLDAICEEVDTDDPFAAIPRYRLRHDSGNLPRGQ
jgi:hypothetical protein